MRRSQIALRVVVLLGPVVAVLMTGPDGNYPPWWVVLVILATAVGAARQPDGPLPATAGLAVVAWWAAEVGDRVPASVLFAAVALVAAHVAAVLASYGPETMPLDRATVLLWLRRGALVLLTVPVAWFLARVLRGEPEQPGIWLLGVGAVLVAIVVATVAYPLGAGDQEV